VQIQVTKLRRGEKLTELLADESSEELQPTRFDKIRVIHGQPFSSAGFAQKLRALEGAARRNSLSDIYRAFLELGIGFQMPEIEPSQPVPKAVPARATFAGARS